VNIARFYHNGEKWLEAVEQAGATYYRSEVEKAFWPEIEADFFLRWKTNAEKEIYSKLGRYEYVDVETHVGPDDYDCAYKFHIIGFGYEEADLTNENTLRILIGWLVKNGSLRQIRELALNHITE
jgi:hypothetical protein